MRLSTRVIVSVFCGLFWLEAYLSTSMVPPHPTAENITSTPIIRPYDNTLLSSDRVLRANSQHQKKKLQLIRTSGKLKVLVILMQFEDHQDRTLIDPIDIHKFFQAENGTPTTTESVKNYFFINSYGLLEIDALVVPWRVVGFTEQDCIFGNSGMDGKFQKCFWPILDLLDELHVNSSHDFHWSHFDKNLDGFIDSLVIMHSGYGAEWGGIDPMGMTPKQRIWSHSMPPQDESWRSPSYVIDVGSYCVTSVFQGVEGNRIAHLGILLHEMLHTLGLPDLFDLSRSDQQGGIGSYSIMSDVWGQGNNNTLPGPLDPWSKIKLGWLKPIPISFDRTYRLQPLSTTPEVFIIEEPYPDGESLLIESRRLVSNDGGQQTYGALIWHVDEKATLNTKAGGTYQGDEWPTNGKHYQVALVQADGNFDLEQAINKGDDGDFFTEGMTLGPGKGSTEYPNTDSYQDGNVIETGITLSGFEVDGLYLQFEVNGIVKSMNHETVTSVSIRSCPLQINTNLCTFHMQNISLSEDCECYSFCGSGDLQGCSKYGEFGLISCPVGGLVAGCTLDDWGWDISSDYTIPDATGFFRPLNPAQELFLDDVVEEQSDVVEEHSDIVEEESDVMEDQSDIGEDQSDIGEDQSDIGEEPSIVSGRDSGCARRYADSSRGFAGLLIMFWFRGWG